ncbi:PiggyBac transposable element-derived protein 4, partial [Stegodyphus mimosarum]
MQYSPLKKARFGIKSFLLCESKSGYMWDAIIYSGMGTNFDNSFYDLSMSARVVMTLTKPLLDKGYCLTMDNFYNSPGLVHMLIKRKTDVCGTLQ